MSRNEEKYNDKVKKIITTYITIMVIFTMGNSIFAPIFIPYMTGKGMSTFEANLVMSVIMFTIFLFEIPTGVISDLFGRKKSFAISLILMIIAKIVFLLSFNLLGFCIGAVIDGVAFAFSSGSLEAWVVDEVKKNGMEKFQTIFASVGKYSRYASIIAGFIGGYLITRSYSYVWILSAIFLIICTIIVLKYVEEDKSNFVKKKMNVKEGWKGMKEITQKSLKECRKNSLLLFLILLASFEALFLGGCFQLWTKHIPEVISINGIISWVWALLAVSAIIGNTIVQKMNWKDESRLTIVMILNSLTSIIFIAAGLFKNGWAIIAVFMLKNIITGIKRPIIGSVLNENIDDRNRSTILSFNSQCVSIFHNVGLLAMGAIAARSGIKASWFAAGVLFFSVVPMWIIMKRKFEQRTSVELES